MSVDPRPVMRLDKWLWHARFFKTRSLAAGIVSRGRVRVNSRKVSKPAHRVGAGDVLTFAQAKDIRVVQIVALADRRGPAIEAQKLYCDLDAAGNDIPSSDELPGNDRRRYRG